MLCLTNQIIAQIFVTCGESVLAPYFFRSPSFGIQQVIKTEVEKAQEQG